MEKDLVLKKLKEKRRQFREDIWRRNLLVGFCILLIFAIYLNFEYFGILSIEHRVNSDIITLVIMFCILVFSMGICHYFSYSFFNKKYADEIEERIENQSEFFLRFLGHYALSFEEKKKIETLNRITNVGSCQKIEVSCINDYVNIFAFTYGKNEKGLLIQTRVLAEANTLTQIRNDDRVLAALNGENAIKTYYPESEGTLRNFVGFSTIKPGPEGFFTSSRREIIKVLAEFPQYKYCLTQTENDVTLMIDGLTLRYGDHLLGVFDDIRFARHLAIRKLMKSSVAVVSKTTRDTRP